MTTRIMPIAWRGAALARDRTPTRYSYQRVVGPHHVIAGGSRELPSAMQLNKPGANESKAIGEYIALRRFREPPVFTSFRRDQRWGEYCEGGGWRAKAAPLQALGDCTRR